MFSILALGGGGAKGHLEIGSLIAIEEKYGCLHKYFTGGVYGCSIGSLFATCVAFGLNSADIVKLSADFAEPYEVFDLTSLASVDIMLGKKGIFNMDNYEASIIKSFANAGIDIKNKKLKDAIIPLYIVASNITKGMPCVFQDDVPVLTAIRASSAIPVLFYPEIINSSVYIDGGFYSNIIMNIIPREDREKTLSVSIIHTIPVISPKSLPQMDPFDYLYSLYKTSCLYERYKNKHPNNIDLYYRGGNGVSVFSKKEKEDMVLIGQTLTREFFRTKCAS